MATNTQSQSTAERAPEYLRPQAPTEQLVLPDMFKYMPQQCQIEFVTLQD